MKLLLNNNSYINWYLRKTENIDAIKIHKHNPHYLSSIEIDTDTRDMLESLGYGSLSGVGVVGGR